MNKPYVVNIQKYSIHDGDGIRTTIFFKGCGLNCWWCHNPESQKFTPELMVDQERCTGCGNCITHCQQEAITLKEGKVELDLSKCIACGACVDYCINNNREIVGKQYEIKELLKIIAKDKTFYEQSNGGVTLSGGEVMAINMDYLERLCQAIKDQGYNLCIDSCGYAKTENYLKIAPYVDTFLYDLKSLDDQVHRRYMGQSNELILKNLEAINKTSAKINIRIPVIGMVNESTEQINLIIDYLIKQQIKVVKINLLPYHATGSGKYAKLQRDYLAKDCFTPSKERMMEILQMFKDKGFSNIQIGG